jgi:hypothetical protein
MVDAAFASGADQNGDGEIDEKELTDLMASGNQGSNEDGGEDDDGQDDYGNESGEDNGEDNGEDGE